MGTLFLGLLLETAPPFYVVIRATQELAICGAKAVPSFLSYFETLSIGLAQGIEAATSRSGVKRSTDWANLATVEVPITTQSIAGLKGVANIADDLVVHGGNGEEHDKNLAKSSNRRGVLRSGGGGGVTSQ